MSLTREQFETLALAQLDTLYRVARRFTRNTTAAEDLVQETYVRALEAWQSFELHDKGIRPWLVRVMHNLYINRAQRDAREPHPIEPAFLDVEEDLCCPAQKANFELMDEQVVQAVQQLPHDQQVILLLWAVEDMPYAEIAHSLGIPIGTVMSRLHRARVKLNEQLATFAKQEGMIRRVELKQA